jgi:tetratricopeptide (TPR) repeat protein
LAFGGRALFEGLRLLVAPLAYPPRYDGAPGFDPALARGAAWPWLAAIGWAAWTACLVGGATAWRTALARGGRERALVPASAVLAALAALPLVQLVPAGVVFAPRFLYLPLLVGAPLAGAVLARTGPRVAALVLALCVPLAWQRAGVYAGRESWARATLAHAPDDAGAWNVLGTALEERGDLDGARRAWLAATDADPGYGRAWSQLGRLALAAGDEAAARTAFERALRLGPTNPVALCNLASLHLRGREPAAALPLYRLATENAPGFAPAWRGLGHALLELERLPEARAALERALALAPADPAARRLLERAGG